jgi:hypothetical protein
MTESERAAAVCRIRDLSRQREVHQAKVKLIEAEMDQLTAEVVADLCEEPWAI